MPATDLLIDGYNLLHAAGYGRLRYAPGDLQRARQRLLKKLFQLLTPAEISQTAVVFDAKEPPPGLPKNWYIHGLRVLYAQPHGDADAMLEQLIDEHSAPKQLTVVSSDHRLHRAARRRRATAIDSDEFLEHLERRHPNPELEALPDPAPNSPKATGDSTSGELDYWMRLFGDVRVSDLIETKRPKLERAPVKPDSKSITPDHTVAPKSKHGTRNSKAKSTPGRDENLKSDDNRPSLFSQEWIDDLQRWVDGMQGA